MPEPSNSQARRIRDEVQTLLQVAAVQQADKARPPNVEGQLLKNAMSQPKMKKRCRSISSRPLEGKRPHSSSLSTTNDDMTRDAILKRIVAVGMGTRKNAVTAPTAAGGTTVMRTG